MDVPSICMVDDIMSIQKCSDSGKTNAVINAFIEMKKLKLSHKKCSRIHIGKHTTECPELKVHEHRMKNSSQEKYLGDLLDQSGSIKPTIQDRVSKAWGIISEIKAILTEIPLGKYRLEMGLKLRQAMLVNGSLYNSEAWHSVSTEDIRGLEKVDEALLRCLLDCHSKVPLEFLYLESGAIPLRFILSARRINYLKTILNREPEELTRRIYDAQILKPCDGDFVDLVAKDLDTIGVPLNPTIIQNTDREVFRKHIKSRIAAAAFRYLTAQQTTHSKVKNIKYEKLEVQPYLTSQLFNNQETRLLTALRSRTHKGFKHNFSNLYGGHIQCPLNCSEDPENPNIDSQQHLLECSKVLQEFETSDISNEKVNYNDIFGANTKKHKEHAVLFLQLLEIKEKLIEEPGTLDP